VSCMLAAGSLLAALVQPEAAECGGTKRKKGTVVEEFYEVDCIKARRLVKGGRAHRPLQGIKELLAKRAKETPEDAEAF